MKHQMNPAAVSDLLDMITQIYFSNIMIIYSTSQIYLARLRLESR